MKNKEELLTEIIADLAKNEQDSLEKIVDLLEVKPEFINSQLDKAILYHQKNTYWKEVSLSSLLIDSITRYSQENADDLIIDLLKSSYEEGAVISYVNPSDTFNPEKLGFENILVEQSSKLENLHSDKGDGRIEDRQFLGALSHISRIYRLARVDAGIKRDIEDWIQIDSIKNKPKYAIYYEGDLPLGYIIYSISDSLTVYELVHLSSKAYKAMVYFLQKLGNDKGISNVQYQTFIGQGPLIPGENIIASPYSLMRIINLPEFLKVNPDLDFLLEITDSVIPENNGVYGDSRSPKVAMTINEFTRYIMAGIEPTHKLKN